MLCLLLQLSQFQSELVINAFSVHIDIARYHYVVVLRLDSLLHNDFIWLHDYHLKVLVDIVIMFSVTFLELWKSFKQVSIDIPVSELAM